MKILIDIGHPAHVHLFKNLIGNLRKDGHEVIITARDKEIALARQVAMYLIREETNHPLAQIGRELGNRNPSTVSHACEKIAAEMSASPYLRRKIQDVRQQVLPR